MSRYQSLKRSKCGRIVIAVSTLVIAGCETEAHNIDGARAEVTQDAMNGSPFGSPQQSSLLAKFEGTWISNFEKTMQANKAAGVPDDQIERARQLAAKDPQFAKPHSDVTLTGNVLRGTGLLSPEYWCFGLHQHGDIVCGKAWHHEDRFDPGDMSKCYIRLHLQDGDLHMDVRHLTNDLTRMDPDLKAVLQADSDLNSVFQIDMPSATCECGERTQGDFDEWTTVVFERQN